MSEHLSREALTRVLLGDVAEPEVDETAIPHLMRCTCCLDLAAEVVEELRSGSTFVPPSEAWEAFVTVLDTDRQQSLDSLHARGLWAGLKSLSPAKKRDRLRPVSALQMRKVFEIAISEADEATDPHVGEETALTAFALADLLSPAQATAEAKNDFRGRTMAEVANCRRLAADWAASRTAMKEAGGFLHKGSGEPRFRARLLSVAASLASDTGSFEIAHRLLAQSGDLYRRAGDEAGVASVTVQEANSLFAAYRLEDAVRKAQDALKLLSPGDDRLAMLARSIITECLIDMQHPHQAFRSFLATRPLYDRFQGRETKMKSVQYLEARLLDAFGYGRASEDAFRELIESDLAEELYKDAFIHTLTLFESFYRRGELDKAARLCEEAAGLLDTPLSHPQVKQVWEQLLAQVRSEALTVKRLLQVRLYFLRYWNVPAARLTFGENGSTAIAVSEGSGPWGELEAAAGQKRPESPNSGEQIEQRTTDPADLPDLADGGYWQALHDYDRKLIAAALVQTGGNIEKTTQLIGMSRNGLLAKIEALRLKPLLARLRRPKVKSIGPRRRARYGSPSQDKPRS